MTAMTSAPKPTSITEDGHRDADVANMESWEDMSRASLIHKIEEGHPRTGPWLEDERG